MKFEAAQRTMAEANVGGAPGVFFSGMVWMTAGFAEHRFGVEVAFAVMFVGGMLITPAALLIGRSIFSTPKASGNNPLNRLGLESALVLFAGLLIAYALLQIAPELVFPVLGIVIGTRYFAFQTIYNEPVYWALGGSLAAVGTVFLLRLIQMPIGIVFIVALIELCFASLLLFRWKRTHAAR